jgi:hypothetical protein
MGSLSTMFPAEVMVILRCTELLLTKNVMRRRTHNSSCENDNRIIFGLDLYVSAGKTKCTQQGHISVDTQASKNTR